jgi:hypothetical protein
MKLSFIPKEKKEVLPVVVILECYWVVDWAMTSRFVERSPRDILSTMLSAPQSHALSSTSELSIVQRGDLLIFAVLVPLPTARESSEHSNAAGFLFRSWKRSAWRK